MNICIPTIEEKGIKSRISRHFGRAPFHTLVNLDTLETKILRKDGDCDEGTHGRCMPVDLLLTNDVDLVACKGIGRGALKRLAASNIRVFATEAETVWAVVEDYRAQGDAGKQQPDVCDGHGHHH